MVASGAGFRVFWSDDRAESNGGYHIWSRLLDADGAPAGNEIPLTTGAEYADLWTVDATASGFVVAGGSFVDVPPAPRSFLLRADTNGAPLGDRLTIGSSRQLPAVAVSGERIGVLYGDAFEVRGSDLSLVAGPAPFLSPVTSNIRYSSLVASGEGFVGSAATDVAEDVPRAQILKLGGCN
jgi:hypothetical protein